MVYVLLWILVYLLVGWVLLRKVLFLKLLLCTLKLELAQYRDIAGFTKLGTELDEATQKILDRGRIYETLLIQKPYRPLNYFNASITFNSGYVWLFGCC
jgi:F0F1-type ATP synthase alpha subunit